MMLISPSMSHFPHPIHPAPFSPPSLFCTGVVVEVGVAGSSTWCARLQLQNTSHPVGYAVAAGSVYTLCVRGMSNVIRADFPHMQQATATATATATAGGCPNPTPNLPSLRSVCHQQPSLNLFQITLNIFVSMLERN